MVTTGQRFLNDAPSISLSSLPTASHNNISLPALAVNFIMFQNNGSELPFYDPNYFTYAIQTECVDENGNYVSEDLDGQLCNVPWARGTAARNAMCPQRKPVLKGLYTSNVDYCYVRIDVVTCDQTQPNNTCVSIGDADATLSSGYFALLMLQDNNNGDKLGNVQTFSATSSAASWYDLVFSTYIVQTSPNLFTSFFETTFTFLKYQSERYALIYIYPPGYIDTAGRQVLTLRFLLSGDLTVENRHRQTVLDLFGQWSALYSAIFAVLAVYFLSHNESTFYTSNPEWDQMDSHLHSSAARNRSDPLPPSKPIADDDAADDISPSTTANVFLPVPSTCGNVDDGLIVLNEIGDSPSKQQDQKAP